MRRHLFWAVILVGFSGVATAAETTVPRYVGFRDGTVLRLPVVDEDRQVTFLRDDGRLETSTLRLSSLQRLQLAPQRVFDKKRKILAAVDRLGSDEFSEREQAEDELSRMGADIRADLDLAAGMFSDVEIRYRLRRILARWPAPADKSFQHPIPYDLITTNAAGWGDVGEEGIAVLVDGKRRRLSRQEVQGVSVQAPETFDFGSERPGPTGFRRIQEKDFPRGCVEESFETAPDGRKLTVGENVERVFVNKGFVLSTSITTSYVSVNNFKVNGKSGGLSCATHQPLYQGEVTVRFCQPGREDVPAGVSYFGCWMAVVMPKGTALVAYDVQGREIGKIETEQGPHEFMGIHSAVPMYKVRVVPNLQIDPDYTLDDFIYSPPQTADFAHPEKYTVYCGDGERVLCGDVGFAAGEARLHGLTAGLADQTRPLAEVLRVNAPARTRQGVGTPTGLFAELRDGSVVFGSVSKKGALEFARQSAAWQKPGELVALWKSDFPRIGWPEKAFVTWDAQKKTWQAVADVALTEEAVQWTEGGNRQTRRYADVSALLLGRPASALQPGWHVRTIQGDDLVLDGGEAVKLDGQLSQELQAVWQAKPLRIPAKELVSVFRVVKKP